MQLFMADSFSALGTTRGVWSLLSSLSGLVIFVWDIYLNGGGIRFLNSFSVTNVGAPAPQKPVRLVWTWAFVWNCLAVDAALTFISCAPFFLRLMANYRPAIWDEVYPVHPSKPKRADGGKEDANLANQPPAGTTCEVLRSLDCWSLVLGRLTEIAVLFFMHKYQS